MKKELSIWSAPLLEGFRKPAYRLVPTAGFLMPTSIPLLQSLVTVL